MPFKRESHRTKKWWIFNKQRFSIRAFSTTYAESDQTNNSRGINSNWLFMISQYPLTYHEKSNGFHIKSQNLWPPMTNQIEKSTWIEYD